MDWLVARQSRVERALAARHLGQGSLVLYDLTSVYVEGSHCPLARLDHSRDHRHDRPRIEFGLLTETRCCPVALGAFPGSTADPATVGKRFVRGPAAPEARPHRGLVRPALREVPQALTPDAGVSPGSTGCGPA